MKTNCKNCGAPLVGNRCEYCGTEYEYIMELDSFEQVIELNIGGQKRKFYINEISAEPICITDYQSIDMTCKRTRIESSPRIKIELISYN
jgi:hypothetical protein